LKLGKVIREFEVEFDEELIPPLADVPSLPAPNRSLNGRSAVRGNFTAE